MSPLLGIDIEAPPEMNRIRAARQARAWTQAELAGRARVSPRTIHAIEKGQACRQATKRKILTALGVPWELREQYFPRPVRVPVRVPTLSAISKSA